MSDKTTTANDIVMIKDTLLRMKNFEQRVGMAIRRSLDEVIDGARTGRWSVKQLKKTEKTYIGTKVEIVLRDEFGLEEGNKLDVRICGKEVDIKWSLSGAWMIPNECIGEICLVVTADDDKSIFSIGLICATQDCLTLKKNRDQKGRFSKHGKGLVVWLVQDGPLPENFLLHLPKDVRKRILAHKGGQSRVDALFREVQNRLIPRDVILTLARQHDPMKRIRDARIRLEGEGIVILGGQEAEHKRVAKQYGLPTLKKGESLSFRIASGESDE